MTNVQTIQFHNQQIVTLEANGTYYVAMKPICENLGLDWAGQYRRIQRDEVLNSTVVMTTTVAEDGKAREMLCLPIDYLNGWLFGVDVSRVNSEVKDVLVTYKKECYQVLHDYWFKGATVLPTQPVSQTEDKMRALAFVISQTSLAPIAKETLLITTAENVTGVTIPYRPQIERKTYSAKEIGKQLGISATKVGRLANTHNLKTKEYGVCYLSKSQYSDKQVETWRYYDSVIPIFKTIITPAAA